MIVDVHTHIFPPDLIERREELIRSEPAFAEMYGNARARMATLDDLRLAMERAGVDTAVINGFAWRDRELCRRHNEYLLEEASGDRARLLPFCTLPLNDPESAQAEVLRCVRSGARGFGELRPESQGADLGAAPVQELLAWASVAYDVPLLFHASEPVGHRYGGKQGLSLGPLYAFITEHEDVRVVAAHWGGGLPLYALMPEVKDALANVWFDTAATTLLYDPAIFRVVSDLIGASRILFGSDFPLLAPAGQIDAVRRAELNPLELDAILGGNAAAIFGLLQDTAHE
jgi:predicted TIM-barrel fold metal-dependent hydrolase